MKNLQARVFGQWVVKCRGYRTSTQYTWLCKTACELAGISYNQVKDAGKPSTGGSYQTAFDKTVKRL